jgi:O-antigen biosynthesis protein
MLKQHPYDEVVVKPGVQVSPVTVCISLFNYAGYILETLWSVYEQSQALLDLVIVDDASSDDSLGIVQAWLGEWAARFNAVKLVRHRANQGVSASRNTAVHLATTPTVFILDADDVLHSRCVARCLSVLEADLQASMAYPLIEKFGNKTGIKGNVVWHQESFKQANHIDAMSLIRKHDLEAVGGYSECSYIGHLGWSAYDLWCKFIEQGLYSVPVGELLARHRYHSASLWQRTNQQPSLLASLEWEFHLAHPWLQSESDQATLPIQRSESKVQVASTKVDPALCVELADALMLTQQIDDAIDFYQVALNLKPGDDAIQIRLDRALEQRQQLSNGLGFKVLSATYALWLKENMPTSVDLHQISESIKYLAYRPLISIIVPVYNPPEAFLTAMLQSVLAQVYPHWELCIADDASSQPHVKQILKTFATQDKRIKLILREQNGHISAASNSALQLATGEFVTLLDHDDLLTPDALYEVAALLNQQPQADVIYSDEDKINEQEALLDPFFKPDWCPDFLLSQNYICHLGTYRRTLVNEVGGFRVGYEGSQDYDLLLRVTEKTQNIFHIPKVLYHWRMHSASAASNEGAKPYAYDAGARALKDSLQRRGITGRVIMHPTVTGVYTVRYQIDAFKRVSIIIPTRNFGDVLDRCLQSIFTKSTYPNYEVIVVDNGSDQLETLQIFDTWQKREPERFHVHRLDIPFNYSKLNNFGVAHAQGDYLLFLNNDTEVITPDWLEAMVEQAQRSAIGAVGARLLYPDNTIQHAGVVLGIGGIAGHGHKYFEEHSEGYFRQLICVSNYSAVTAACLMCRREAYVQVGGFDELLQVAFNDVDFCLKLRQRGYHNLSLSHVVLYHHESKSRGTDNTPEKQSRFDQEVKIMQTRWKALLEQDPCYSSNLTLKHENYQLRLRTYPEILEVALAVNTEEHFWGVSIDEPQVGLQEAGAIQISGWAVGRHAQVATIEIHCGQAMVCQVPLETRRPDVAQVFNHVSYAQESGFATLLNMAELPSEATLNLQAIFDGYRSVALSTIRLRC